VIKFLSISSFRDSIVAYCKKDEFGYRNCKKDICDFFAKKDIHTIFNHPILIAPSKDYRLIKSRIINSCYNKGKSGSYRIYYYVDIKNACIYLLSFYPKTGKYGRDSLSATELKFLIKNFNQEKQLNSLLKHDINNLLEIITPKMLNG
jgi:mRNA-degrading endonuclease RelE of RelBE toxin-antitoxin system